MRPLLLPLVVLTMALMTACSTANRDVLISTDVLPRTLYIGTYTRGQSQSKGIYASRFDPATGELAPPVLAVATDNPSFLSVGPEHLYAANEISQFEGKATGSISAFAHGPGHTLQLVNQQASAGAGPCYVTLTPQAGALLAANYGGGSVALLPIRDDGSLAAPASVVQHEGSSVNERRQKGPHAHCIRVAPGGGFAVAVDLGIDKLLIYALDPRNGTLKAHGETPTAPGAGPRHLAFHPSGNFAFVINELNSTITTYGWDERRGTLTPDGTVTTLPADFTGNNSPAEVVVHPSGRFVYGSNRGHDSIAIFRVDERTGRLTPSGHQSTGGKTPRNFVVDPTGRWLLAANQNSGNITVFRIDKETGGLKATGHEIRVDAPVCLRFAAW